VRWLLMAPFSVAGLLILLVVIAEAIAAQRLEREQA
jgi:hypothetical protein